MSTRLSSQLPFSDLPEGTVTFLFTDIEGSTQLLARLRDKYAILLDDHRTILREAFTNWAGHEVDTQGDAFFVAFSRATQAVCAAVEAQRQLSEHAWPEGVTVKVRMGIHTGEPWSAQEGYVGMDVHRAARLAHVGHGGQVLLSETTTALVQDELPQGVTLLDLGRHLLKDIHRPERISQLLIEGLSSEFPPLTSQQMLPPETARTPRKVGDCPYRGLAAFREVDAPFYFGREAFIDILENAIQTKKLVAVIVGASGSGKSSVLLAGLLPRLRKAGGYQFAVFRPGPQPFYALAGAIISLLETTLSETDYLAETRKLAEKLTCGEVTLVQVAERIAQKSLTEQKLLLIVDQFEELYTLCPDDKLQNAFINELLEVAKAARAQRSAISVVLLTLRADFMGQALTHRPFADALQEASLLMGPMNRQELHMAIEKPAEMQGAAFEPGLVERILDDVGEKPGNLPLLEFTLTQLWVLQTDGWLTHADYEAMGCVEGALAAYADQVYAALDEGEQELARHALVQLVQPGEGTEDTRRIATKEDLGDDNWRLIQHLADKRLVITGRDVQGRETVEVVHEALIHKWGRFREWMDTDRSFRSWQEQLRNNLRQWQESGQETGALLSGGRLSMARLWLAERGDDFSQAEKEYILASQAQQQILQEAETARQKREVALTHRARNFLYALVAILLLAVIGTSGLAYVARRAQGSAEAQSMARATQQSIAEAEKANAQAQSLSRATAEAVAEAEALSRATSEANALTQANLARARELSLAALNNLETDPELSILLGLQSASTYQSLGQSLPNDLQYTLHQAIPASRARLTWSAGEDSILASGFTNPSDQPRVLTANSALGTITLWDPLQEQKLFEISALDPDQIKATISYDGRWVALADHNKIRFWDVGSGKELPSLSVYPSEIIGGTFSPDSQSILTWDYSKYTLWDMKTGKIRLEIPNLHTTRQVAVFSPDGRLIAARTPGNAIGIFDVRSGELVSTIQLQQNMDIIALAFNPDRTRLAGTGRSTRCIIWDVQTGTDVLSFDISLGTISSGGEIETIAFSPDGTRLALPGAIYDSTSGEELFPLQGHTQAVFNVFFNQDGTHLLTASDDQTVKIWDLTPSHEVLTLIHPSGGPLYGLAFSPDGKWLVTTGADKTAQVWELATGKLIQTLEGHTDIVNCADFSPDGTLLATGSADHSVRVWDTQSWVMLHRLTGHSTDKVGFDPMIRGVVGVAFSPQCIDSSTQGQICLVAGIGMDGQLIIWNALTGRVWGTYRDPDRGLKSLAFSPDGEQLAVGNISTANFPYANVMLIKVADLNRYIWTAVYYHIFHIESGWVWDLAFSPDGRQLASIYYQGYVTVWDPFYYSELFSLADIQSGNALSFDPTGSYLATAGNGTIRLWDAPTGEPFFNLTGYAPMTNYDIAFSPDGKYLASSSFDGTARVYVIPSDDLVAFARSRLTRGFTLEECQKYLHVDVCPTLP